MNKVFSIFFILVIKPRSHVNKKVSFWIKYVKFRKKVCNYKMSNDFTVTSGVELMRLELLPQCFMVVYLPVNLIINIHYMYDKCV